MVWVGTLLYQTPSLNLSPAETQTSPSLMVWFRAMVSEDVPLWNWRRRKISNLMEFMRLQSPMLIGEGFLGEGRVVSLPNMKTTSDMVDRSVAHS